MLQIHSSFIYFDSLETLLLQNRKQIKATSKGRCWSQTKKGKTEAPRSRASRTSFEGSPAALSVCVGPRSCHDGTGTKAGKRSQCWQRPDPREPAGRRARAGLPWRSSLLCASLCEKTTVESRRKQLPAHCLWPQVRTVTWVSQSRPEGSSLPAALTPSVEFPASASVRDEGGDRRRTEGQTACCRSPLPRVPFPASNQQDFSLTSPCSLSLETQGLGQHPGGSRDCNKKPSYLKTPSLGRRGLCYRTRGLEDGPKKAQWLPLTSCLKTDIPTQRPVSWAWGLCWSGTDRICYSLRLKFQKICSLTWQKKTALPLEPWFLRQSSISSIFL